MLAKPTKRQSVWRLEVKSMRKRERTRSFQGCQHNLLSSALSFRESMIYDPVDSVGCPVARFAIAPRSPSQMAFTSRRHKLPPRVRVIGLSGERLNARIRKCEKTWRLSAVSYLNSSWLCDKASCNRTSSLRLFCSSCSASSRDIASASCSWSSSSPTVCGRAHSSSAARQSKTIFKVMGNQVCMKRLFQS